MDTLDDLRARLDALENDAGKAHPLVIRRIAALEMQAQALRVAIDQVIDALRHAGLDEWRTRP